MPTLICFKNKTKQNKTKSIISHISSPRHKYECLLWIFRLCRIFTMSFLLCWEESMLPGWSWTMAAVKCYWSGLWILCNELKKTIEKIKLACLCHCNTEPFWGHWYVFLIQHKWKFWQFSRIKDTPRLTVAAETVKSSENLKANSYVCGVTSKLLQLWSLRRNTMC